MNHVLGCDDTENSVSYHRITGCGDVKNSVLKLYEIIFWAAMMLQTVLHISMFWEAMMETVFHVRIMNSCLVT